MKDILGEPLRKAIEDCLTSLFGAIDEVVGWDQIEEFLEVLLSDSDRGCVLSVSASLDFVLETKIRARFRELSNASKTDLDFLFSKRPVPPLQSTGIKIVVATVLGILDPQDRKTLQVIQAIRNSYAHSAYSKRLTEETSKKILDSLVTKDSELVQKILGHWDKQTDHFAKDLPISIKNSESQPRRVFVATYITLMVNLVFRPKKIPTSRKD